MKTNKEQELRGLLRTSSKHYETIALVCERVVSRFDKTEEEPNEKEIADDILTIRLTLPYVMEDIRKIKKELEG